MLALILMVAAMVFDFLLMAILVGIAYYAVFGHRINLLKSRMPLFILFCIFAILDTYNLPLFILLDIKIIIGNEKFVELIGQNEMDAREFFDPGWFDLIIYLVQMKVAQYAGSKVYGKLRAQETAPETA